LQRSIETGQSFAIIVEYSNVDSADPFDKMQTQPATPLGFTTSSSTETSQDGMLLAVSFVNAAFAFERCSPPAPLCDRLSNESISVGDFFQATAGPAPIFSSGCTHTRAGASAVLPLRPSRR